MTKFYSLHFNVHEVGLEGLETMPKGISWAVASMESSPEEEALRTSAGANDETAARRYLESLLGERDEMALRSLVAPERAAVMPDLRLEAMAESPLTGTRLVKFAQTSRSIPIFGTRAVVELDGGDRSLVAVEAEFADVPEVSPLASISSVQALEAIARFCKVDLEPLKTVSAPDINFFVDPDEGKTWHLVYHYTEVPATPPEAKEESGSLQGCSGACRMNLATYDFLVDAHTGQIVFYFATHPSLADIPVKCTGVDELGVKREFYGRNFGTGFELHDPLRGVKTFDQQFQDISGPSLPVNPCQNATADFGNVSTAAVSAHYHAQVVFDFFNNVLKRKSIDDKGMVIMSMVNCTSPQDEPPPNWHNAAWWSGRMWYGQVQAGGKFESFSRYLDVIGHELSHGVTETTSNLVYKNQSGALNESFSDIFGVMINNWYPNEPNSIGSWNWEIGANLGGGGLPLRDMRNPQRTNDPDHMNNYLQTKRDNGGVHTNSSIHNKAAYNLLTSKDASGNYIFTPVEVGILYYLTLSRLSRMATFSDCLRTLKSVAAIYYSGNTVIRDARIAAIQAAYTAVGIT